jgi:acyl-CoA reductase-like NAD-dependent aldehyde dehydrogenase
MAAHAPQREVDGGAADGIAVTNPGDGRVIGHVPDLPPAEVADLVARGRRVQPAWAALGFEGRAVVLRAMRRWLMDNRERVLAAVIEEGGKTYEDAHLGELVYTADALGFWAKRARGYLADERTRPHSPFLFGRTLVHRHVPFGVVGVIGPWNYPITNNFGDCIPALMAGNAVVLKPSDQTPLTSLLMAEGMRAAGCPEDVFLVATGGAETGRALVDLVDMVHFTARRPPGAGS